MRDVSGRDRASERAEADFSHQRKMRINLGSKEETDEGVLGKFPFVFSSELANYDFFQGCGICSIVHEPGLT